MNGTYMKIVDCFTEMYATSDCSGTPVHREEFQFNGCQESGPSGGSYLMNACSISKPPSAIDMTCMTLEDAAAAEGEMPNCELWRYFAKHMFRRSEYLHEMCTRLRRK